MQLKLGDAVEVHRQIPALDEQAQWRLERIVEVHPNHIHIKCVHFDLQSATTFTSQAKYISAANTRIVPCEHLHSEQDEKWVSISKLYYSSERGSIVFCGRPHRVMQLRLLLFDLRNNTYVANPKVDGELLAFRDANKHSEMATNTNMVFIPSPVNQWHYVQCKHIKTDDKAGHFDSDWNYKTVAVHKRYSKKHPGQLVEIARFKIFSRRVSVERKLKCIAGRLVLLLSSNSSNQMFHCDVSDFRWKRVSAFAKAKHHFPINGTDLFAGYGGSVYLLDIYSRVCAVDLVNDRVYQSEGNGKRILFLANSRAFRVNDLDGVLHIVHLGNNAKVHHYRFALEDVCQVLPVDSKRVYQNKNITLSAGYVRRHEHNEFPMDLAQMVSLFLRWYDFFGVYVL